MPRARTKASPAKTPRKRSLPKEAISLTNWKCWHLVSGNDAMVWPESETSFWRRQEQQKAVSRPRLPRSRPAVVLPQTELARALFLCKAQSKFLDKAREAVAHMHALAQLAQPSEGGLDEFETLAAFLADLANTEIDGHKLFHTANVIVPLEGDNRLILAGIDLNAEAFQAILRARIGTAEEAAAALGILKKGMQFLAINREILSTNIGRLFFAREHEHMAESPAAA